MRRQSRTTERDVARIASRQHGNITRGQLLEAGLSPSGIDRRLRRGVFLRRFPGVYSVGRHAQSTEARYLGAVLACGEGAVLCGLAAAHLMRLVRGRRPAPEVLAPGDRQLRGIHIRRTRRIDGSDYWIFNGIPVATVPRTIADLAAVLSPKALGRAFHEAVVLYRTTPDQVEAVLVRRPNTPGAAVLRDVLRGLLDITLSAVEERFLQRLGEEGLPLPQTNRRHGGRWLDRRWPEHRLVVELDSYRYHGSRHAWEEDRRRERLIRAQGYEFRRYTHDDVIVAPALMLGELRELVA